MIFPLMINLGLWLATTKHIVFGRSRYDERLDPEKKNLQLNLHLDTAGNGDDGGGDGDDDG